MKKYSYENKKVYIGLDVHKKTYALTAKCEGVIVKRDTIKAAPEELVQYCQKRFSGAEIYTAYEAGFCGFYLHRYLMGNGINSIVVHAASIETSSRDRVKTDKRDSLKIATQLEVGRLKGIHVPSEEQEQRREITRLRERHVKDKHVAGCRIKSLLHRHAWIQWDQDKKMSKSLIQDLLKLKLPSAIMYVLKEFAETWLRLEAKIKKIEKELEKQAKKNPEAHSILQSTPGIGLLGASILANELGDMGQFSNVKCLYSFSGLTPSEHSSGEQRRLGHITRQGSLFQDYLLKC